MKPPSAISSKLINPEAGGAIAVTIYGGVPGITAVERAFVDRLLASIEEFEAGRRLPAKSPQPGAPAPPARAR